MKRTMFVLSFLAAVLIVGCQDSTLTDPTGNMPSNDNPLSRNVPGNIILPIRTLPLNGILNEPGSVYNSLMEITGSVAYQATVVALDPIPPNPQYAVRLNLIVNAEVRPYQISVPPLLPVWHVSGTSDDWVPIPESGTAFLTKSYKVEGRIDGMLLKLKFQITLTSVELSSMWLELPRVLRAADLD